jgi:riboflavin kinase/FMN adenylyltransferase
MDLFDDLAKISRQEETVLTIGAFDGVHRGHQALIGVVVSRARTAGRRAALITFHPHPAVVLAPDRAPRYLTTPGEKVAMLEGLGLDLVILLPFDRQVAATPARDFVEMLSARLNLQELWVGPDFALGRDREGDIPYLRALGQELGYELHVFEPVLEGDQVVSSSRIRALLRQGDVEGAARLLGRYPSLSGEVVVGARRGRSLGFPTANLEVRPERAVPADGVYAVFAILGAERYPAVANVGVRPSFDNGQRTVETHIFDFNQDIYGCDLVVEFVARLRDERRFRDIDDLVVQMGEDSRLARQLLADRLSPAAEGEMAREPCRYRFREVEHTADLALRVWGQELSDLFVGAARGMYSLMGVLDEEGLMPAAWHDISLEALDRESLLVDWLNELLFLAEIEGQLFVEFRVEELTGTALQARAGGVPAQEPKADVKAATFHNLEIARDGEGWSATITFDV